MERATDMTESEAVIVAHGSPSDPLPQEEALQSLAAQVASLLPGWTIRSATLAAGGSLDRALEGLRHPYIYPFFMAGGYFTGEVVPNRLKQHAGHYTLLPPFGMDEELPSLVIAYASEAARKKGLNPHNTALLLAAHGSGVSRASRTATERLVENIRAGLAFRAIAAGFIEEAPHLEDVARGYSNAICLPLFALRAGHVEHDIPTALERAGFTGRLLEPIGLHPQVPLLVGRALVRQLARAAA